MKFIPNPSFIFQYDVFFRFASENDIFINF
jgi:hypothetical protein